MYGISETQIEKRGSEKNSTVREPSPLRSASPPCITRAMYISPVTSSLLIVAPYMLEESRYQSANFYKASFDMDEAQNMDSSNIIATSDGSGMSGLFNDKRNCNAT